MKKLQAWYEKNELAAAIFWIVLYTVAVGILRNLGDDSPWTMLGVIVISALMFLFVKALGRTEYYGLARWARNNRAMLFFLPLWIIASMNLWAGITPHYPLPGQIFAVVFMAFVGFAEELIFRGFLFKALLKDGNAKTAVIISSVTFGLGHILNLFTGHAFAEPLMQAVFAISFGFVVTMVFYKSGSLLPCILAHSLFDMFATFASTDATEAMNWIAHGVLVAVAAAYCLYLRRLEPAAVNRAEGKAEAAE